MNRIPVTEDDYVALLNKYLREDPDFKEGMEFKPAPPGSSGRGMSGYSHDDFENVGIYARVAHRVDRKYCLKLESD
jgi:hypothetical protein